MKRGNGRLALVVGLVALVLLASPTAVAAASGAGDRGWISPPGEAETAAIPHGGTASMATTAHPAFASDLTDPLWEYTTQTVASVGVRRTSAVSGTDEAEASEASEAESSETSTRDRLLAAIVRSPGTYTAKLVEETGIPRSTVRYHLRVLEDDGRIVRETVHGKQRVAPSGRGEVAIEQSAVLEDDAAAAVFETVKRLEPANLTEVATALDRSPGTVSYHLDRLEEHDLATRVRDGRAVQIRLTATAADHVADRGAAVTTQSTGAFGDD